MTFKTVYLLEPTSQRAKDWIKENVNTEPWQWTGREALAIEHRYIEDVVSAMQEEGLESGQDFNLL